MVLVSVAGCLKSRYRAHYSKGRSPDVLKLEMLQCKAKHEKRDRVNLSFTHCFALFALRCCNIMKNTIRIQCCSIALVVFSSSSTKLAHMSHLALWSYSSDLSAYRNERWIAIVSSSLKNITFFSLRFWKVPTAALRLTVAIGWKRA